MEANLGRVPPEPPGEYRPGGELLNWLILQFREFGDIFRASLYGATVYAIRNPEFANRVLVENCQNYVKGHMIVRVALLLANGLMVTEGEVWSRHRQMIQPTFNPKSIAASTEMMRAVNSRLLRKWQLAAVKEESVNVTKDVSSAALEVVLRFIFGEDYEHVGLDFDLLHQEHARTMAFARSFQSLRDIILRVINQRRKDKRVDPDALGVLMQARDPQSGSLMRDGQLIDEILTLIVAGHETTASTLNWTWYLISQQPEVEQKLSAELDHLQTASAFEDLPRFLYTRQIIDEAMRLYPAGWLLSRRALHDDQLGEYFVPAGSEIYIPLYCLQRHPDLWEEPDRFNPDRFRTENSKFRHRLATMPFSAGPRNCIGQHFARVEMQIHLMTIARCLRLRYFQSRPLELDAGVNLRSNYDFIMYPEAKEVRSPKAADSA